MEQNIRMSPENDKLFAAMVKAQMLIGSAKKNATNPHLKSNYANLGSVLDAISPALEVQKLAVLQSPLPSEDDKLHLETMIMHESGQWISGVLVMPLVKQDPQGYGSALTYARRYHLSSMLGVVQDDDDAASASKGSVSIAAEAIRAAQNISDLQRIFEAEFKKFRDSPADIRIITDAKDERKAALSVTPGAGFNPAKLAEREPVKQPVDDAPPADAQPITDF